MFPGSSPQGRAPRSNTGNMVTTDPISDMLIRLKNGYMARKSEVLIPWSKTREAIANLLVREKYLAESKVKTTGAKKEITAKLRYEKKIPVLTDVKIISKPSLRIYVKRNKIQRVVNGLGIAIISTPAGLLTDKEARQKGLGGEVICEIW